MNFNDEYDYDDIDDEDTIEAELINEGRKTERRALAQTLTRLRNHTAANTNPGEQSNRDGYLAALDAVARAHGLRIETELRYSA